MNQGGSGRPGFFMRAQRAGGTRPQALLSPATLCHSDIIATALSPARVGPAHMHSSRVWYYCNTHVKSELGVNYLLDTKCRAWFLIRNISVMVYPLSKKGTINFL